MALGADWCNSARGFMFAVGCIQSQRCHTNKCPVGVTTQDPQAPARAGRARQGRAGAKFHRNTVHALAEMVAAMGLDHTSELQPRPGVQTGQPQPGPDVRRDLHPFVDRALLEGTAAERFQHTGMGRPVLRPFVPTQRRRCLTPEEPATTMSKTKNVAQVLLDILADAGARDIFGVTGDALNTLLEAHPPRRPLPAGSASATRRTRPTPPTPRPSSAAASACAPAPWAPARCTSSTGCTTPSARAPASWPSPGRSRGSRGAPATSRRSTSRRPSTTSASYQAVVNSPEQAGRVMEIAVQKALVERWVVRIELPVDIIGRRWTAATSCTR